ncbi:spore coat assembly protein SafA [Chryseomicrobium aureum]|uniref:LysM peptidoglycan-binding domain-containing protein n=1 Tax=Chryseomicrobium aureum TaxID=1441723 RepID=UPI001959DE08|nr:spore coat assembly protein SafA [Chryseomicrobium aureum]
MQTHTVQKGGTMWKIARMYGITLDQLIAENPQIPDPNRITVGMKVYLPTSLFTIHTVKAGERYKVDRLRSCKLYRPR